MWNLPGPGIEPTSPVLTGGFLAAGPPGKSHFKILGPSRSFMEGVGLIFAETTLSF